METDPQADYAHGSVPFLDCTIFLDSKPLIPRLETEYWVEKAIDEIRLHAAHARRALDLFAGSGAIGVALLKHLPDITVDFGEIEARHLPTIEKNVRENGIDPARGRCIQTNVFEHLTDTYDVICANPPYLSEARRALIQDSVMTHEPAEALFADDDGLALLHKTIFEAPRHLSPHGILFLEHDPDQTAAVAAAAAEHGLSGKTHKDQFGLLRWSELFVA